MIGIIDYGLGNLRSVAGAVAKIGYEPVISSDADILETCAKLILPGVGAFGDGMTNLHHRGLVEVLNDLVLKRGRPIIGICLGFQLLGRSSDEFGLWNGLGWIDADVRAFKLDDASLRIPHVGWNELHQTNECILFDDVPDRALFYFVHKYRMERPPNGSLVGTCDYGGTFTAAVQKGNIFGTQFHPEKSQRHGLQMLKNFLDKA